MIGWLNKNNHIGQTSKEKAVLAYLNRCGQQELIPLIESLESSLKGLNYKQVEEKKEQYGANIIASEKPPAWYSQLFSACINPFNIVLFFLSLLSWTSGDLESVVIMLAMVTISVSIRFTQEYRSNKEAQKLKSLVQITTTIQRVNENGEQTIKEIPVHELVPGDIIMLSAGDMIPADIRIIAARDLFITQSMLTGESTPLEKTDQLGDETLNVFDRPNLSFMGSNVISGTAKAVVIATGNQTYFGSLAKAIIGTNVETSFDKGINKVSWLLIYFICMMTPLIFIINGLFKHDWFEALMFAISVAVGLTPEMLPMIVTANLAKGALRMVQQKVVVKQLSAIHNLGAMDILCTDKTGTLTQDRIVLQNHLNIYGDEDVSVLKYAYLNSKYQTGLKNLLDIAVLEEAEKKHPHDFEHFNTGFSKVDELPFDFARRRMSVIVADKNGEHTLICKGAIEELLSICTQAEHEGKIIPLNSQLKDSLKDFANHYNEDGYRVLIVAYRKLANAQISYNKEDEKDFIIKGLLTFLDPPKESAYQAIPSLLQLGVRLKVLTGDNALVTRSICQQVGIKSEHILLGNEIAAMTDEQLSTIVDDITIFAKVSPVQKAQIVKILKAKGHTVGFVGDGVNDSMALREADVGISVDTAVDIAKESADIILLEKSLTVIEDGVIEGRKTFINIIKYIKMALSSNFGNVFSVIGASLLFPFLPMLPLQLLIQNLLYDISQLAIPLDRVDDDLIRNPRTWQTRNLIYFMLFVGPISSIFDYITFGTLWFYFDANSISTQAFFHTGWFIEGLVTQVLIVHMIRTRKIPFIEDNASGILIFASIAIVVLGTWLPFSSLASYFSFVTMPPQYFILLSTVVLGYWGLTSIMKRWYIKRFGQWL